jgi:hypothetical protein
MEAGLDDLRWIMAPMIGVITIIGAFTYAIVQSMHRTRIRELEIKERIAMIEKGLVPPPEVDPRGFDRAMSRYDRVKWTTSAGRHRRAGITLMGVGIGLMVLIGFTAGSDPGLAVGGFLCVLGVAFLVNSLFELRQQPPTPPGNGPTV